MIYLISGKRAAGKDTFCGIFIKLLKGKSVSVALADAPKISFCKERGLDYARFITDRGYKDSYRKEFIDFAVKEQKPFLLWYAPFMPHTPHNPPKRLLDKYDRPDRAMDVAKYYAMCEWFDETCGELLSYIEEKDLTQNTMVIYIADNGWVAGSTYTGDPQKKTGEPFAPRSKGSPYENGIRTPIMVSWPGHMLPGYTQDLAHAIDIFPTIATAADLTTPVGLTGINLLDEKVRKKRKIIFGVSYSIHNMTPGTPDSTLQYLWCIEGDWKLLLRYKGKDTTTYKLVHIWDTAVARLYNLRDDPHEKNDLASSYPELVEHLRKQIEAWHPVNI